MKTNLSAPMDNVQTDVGAVILLLTVLMGLMRSIAVRKMKFFLYQNATLSTVSNAFDT